MNVTNDDGTPMLYVNVRVASGGSVTFTGRVPCAAGKWLAAGSDTGAKIKARRYGTADAFTDLGSDPIDLTPYDSQIVKFEFRVTGLSVSASARAALPVRITFNP